jgi:hypothetical protein
MAEYDKPAPEENISVFRIPRPNRTIASIAMLAAVGSLSACAGEKHCEVVATYTMRSGDTAWDTIDGKIPEADRKDSHDKRERMDWVKQVNPDMETIGAVQAGDTVNVPGNCK